MQQVRCALFALVGLLLAAPAHAQNTPTTWDEIRRDVLPELSARRERAQARADIARAVISGSKRLTELFPGVRAEDLASKAYLTGRRAELDRAAEERALERVTPQPEGLSERLLRRLRDERRAAWEAEEEADSLERRVLAALSASNERARSHTPPEALRAELNEAVERAEQGFAQAGEDDKDAAAAAVFAARDDLARLDALILDLAHLTLAPGARPPSPDEDLSLLDVPARRDAAVARLRLLRPWLDGDPRSRVDGVLSAIAEERITAATLDLEKARAQLDETRSPQSELSVSEDDFAAARLELEQAREALAAVRLRDGDDPMLRAAPRLAELRVAAAEARLQAAELAADRAAAAKATDNADAEAELAGERAAAARKESERLRESDRIGSSLADSLAAEQERTRTRWEETADLRKRLDEREAQLQARFDEHRAAVEAMFGLAPVDRVREADRIFEELRPLITSLREESTKTNNLMLESETARLEAARSAERSAEEITVARSARLSEEQAQLVEQWDLARLDGLRAADEARTAIRDARNRNLRRLKEVKEMRRRLTSEVSRSALRKDAEYRFTDLAKELALLLPNLRALLDRRLNQIADLPRTARKADVLLPALKMLLQLAVLGAFWLWLRRSVPRMVKPVVESMRRRERRRMLRRDLASLVAPLNTTLVALVDLAAGYVLVGPVRSTVPELGLALLVYLQFAAYRFIMGGVRLALAEYPQTRPALAVVQAETHALLLRSVRVLVFWIIARQFTSYVSLEVLGADAMTEAVLLLFRLLLVALALWLAWLWQPRIQRSLKARAETLHLPRFLTEQPSRLLRAPAGLIGLPVLTAVRLYEAFRSRGGSSPFTRVMNLLTRYRLREDPDEPKAPVQDLPPEVLARVGEALDEVDLRTSRAEQAEALFADFRSWTEEGKRGLVAVVGDKGSGREAWLRGAVEALPTGERPLHWATVERRLRTRRQAVKTLAGITGVEPNSSYESLIEPIKELPPSVFVVDQIDRGFLKTVGGFEGLRVLLYVMNATSDRHFWLVSVHLPAWNYLARLGGLMNTEVFRSVHELRALDTAEIRSLLEKRMESIGLSVRFDRMLPVGTAPDLRPAALERTANAFYRLLSENAMGNPGVALTMWARCLCAGPRDDTADVRMDRLMQETVVTGLRDEDMFVLSALRTQEFLTERELVSVTNMSPAVVRSIVKNLQSKGLLYSGDTGIGIELAYLANVTRTLRRRHFIYWKE